MAGRSGDGTYFAYNLRFEQEHFFQDIFWHPIIQSVLEVAHLNTQKYVAHTEEEAYNVQKPNVEMR